MKIFFIVILCFLLWSLMVAVPIGTVISVTDGDTVLVMGEGTKPFKVRLAGIDAPEREQAYGTKSKQALSKLVWKKVVRLQGNKKDRYGRTVSRLFVDNVDISAAMVEQGAAWVYRRYTKDPALYRAEKRAKANRAGLWNANNTIPPWVFRQNKK